MNNSINYYFSKTVWPGIGVVIILWPITFALALYQEILDPSIYITPAVGIALTYHTGYYLLFGLLGFAFFHTKNGYHLPVFYNSTAIAFIAIWVFALFQYWTFSPMTSIQLDRMLDFVVISSAIISVLPFIIFYIITPGKDRFDNDYSPVRVSSKK